ncbi:MAG: hypothetical protein AABW79_03720 [Nanoarchaeota archaeon]
MHKTPSALTLGFLGLIGLVGVPGAYYLSFRVLDNYLNNKNAQREVVKIEQRDTNSDGLADIVLTHRNGKESIYLATIQKETEKEQLTYTLTK